jgi:cell wall-associated NlpC family hydrolase
MHLSDYAKHFIGIPYRWGGQHPEQGYDCSGFIQEVLASRGYDPRGDQTAHDLYEYFMSRNTKMYREPKKDSLLFFGNGHRVSHIAIALNEFQMIEAGGGDSSTTNVQRAIAQGAFVRVRNINKRKDLMAILGVL